MTQPQSSSATTKLSGPQTKNREAWPYADAYDEVTAASEAHLIRYEDEHIRLVEVAYFPGIHTDMHGSPFPSVIARDAPGPQVTEVLLEPDGKLNGQGAGQAPPPIGTQYPVGVTMAPLAPHAVTNNDTFPLHYYKVEFKRIDGDDFRKNWRTWYPWMLEPLRPIDNIDPRDAKLGPPVSEEYPFVAVSESYIAAPNNHYVRYQDDHITLLEVVFRPGERENLHGHADPSVFARDIGASPQVSGPTPVPDPPPPQPATNIPGFNEGAVGDWKLVPDGVNGQGGGSGAPPAGMKWPSCATMGQQWPHAAACSNDYPSHFYRIQYRRIDGDGIRTHWREWYPWMAKLADDYKSR